MPERVLGQLLSKYGELGKTVDKHLYVFLFSLNLFGSRSVKRYGDYFAQQALYLSEVQE